MARVRIKDATIYLQDGSGKTAGTACILGAAVSHDATSATISGAIGSLVNGSWFRVEGDPTDYVVATHADTDGKVTSITFTPACVPEAGWVDEAPIVFTGKRLEMKIGDGDISWSEKTSIEYLLERGEVDEVREGDDVPMDLSLNFTWVELKSKIADTVPTPMEALYQEGPASAWVSSDTDACRPYSLDVVVRLDPECIDKEPEELTFPDFRYEKINPDLKGATLAVSGKCNATEPIVQRLATA